MSSRLYFRCTRLSDGGCFSIDAPGRHSCAGRIGRGESIPLLEKLLTDDHWWVRYHAAEALYTIGGGGILALQTAENGGDTRAEEMARGLLLEKGFST